MLILYGMPFAPLS